MALMALPPVEYSIVLEPSQIVTDDIPRNFNPSVRLEWREVASD
jgi:hypothetical protein